MIEILRFTKFELPEPTSIEFKVQSYYSRSPWEIPISLSFSTYEFMLKFHYSFDCSGMTYDEILNAIPGDAFDYRVEAPSFGFCNLTIDRRVTEAEFMDEQAKWNDRRMRMWLKKDPWSRF